MVRREEDKGGERRVLGWVRVEVKEGAGVLRWNWERVEIKLGGLTR